MHYELYVDSLFLINFIMNLYLLMLVNRTTFRAAGPWRILAGAAVGAVCFLLPLLLEGPAAVKLFAGIAVGTVGMLCITFPVKGLRMFLKLLERLVLYSFGTGGAMLFLIRCFPGIRGYLTGVLGILGMGGILYLLFQRTGWGRNPEHNTCAAVLSKDGKQMMARALIDSGNSLVEPVSGRPVCIVDRALFDSLWGSGGKGFRVIPYHSIGRRKGILPGYLLPGLQLEMEDMKYVFTDVYIAVSEEMISGTGDTGAESVNMIINPGIFTEKGGRRRRQNERHNDSESDNTGQDAV